MPQYKSYFNWSGGKDSALAMYYTLQNPEYSIEKLVTSVNSTYDRISMHGVRTSLLVQQAISLGLPLQQLLMADKPTMAEYNLAMAKTTKELNDDGFTHAIFGDIFLEDLRKYREDKLAEQNLTAHFPLWKRNTTELVHEFIDLGFKTITVCVKSELLDESFVGRIIDKDFLKDLPANVDTCGENGEFHTFVFDGPIFKEPIGYTIGEKILREYEAPKSKDDDCSFNTHATSTNMGFWFCDLLPINHPL